MRDVTSYVGETIPTQEVTQLRTRVNALGWQLQTRPAPAGRQRIVAIVAPAAAEDDAGTDGEQQRTDRVLTTDHDLPALAMAI